MRTIQKTIIFSILVGFTHPTFSQLYERTGRNFGMYFSIQPMAIMKLTNDQLQLSSINGSLGFTTMISRGIYPSIGYTYSSFLNSSIDGNSYPLVKSHTIDASVIFNKRIAILMNKRIKGVCHYISLGLIFAPEYHYTFGTVNRPNESFGEICGQIGLSLYHGKSNASKKSTKQLEVFYRHGFTPNFSQTNSEGTQNFYRQEIGLRLRLIRHQVYDFLQ
jgi:hypothetical protein